MNAGKIKNQTNLVAKAVEFLRNLDNDKELSFTDLIKVSALYNPQQRSSLLENELKNKNNWERISPSENLGDYYDKNKKSFELKTSATNKKNLINIDQIRPWQNVDYYKVIYYDLENPKKSKEYNLTKNQMLEEVKKRGSVSHGTKTANKNNEKIEYSIKLPINNEWDYKYRNLDLVW